MTLELPYRYPVIYDHYFPSDLSFFKTIGLSSLCNRCFRSAEYWESFLSNGSALDFSVSNARTVKELASYVAFCALKFLSLPVQIGRHLVARVIMIPLYPAQSTILSLFYRRFRRSYLAHAREEALLKLTFAGGSFKTFTPVRRSKAESGSELCAHSAPFEGDFIAKEVTLQKNGVKYNGILVGHSNTIENGKWALQATGNGEPIEIDLIEYANFYHRSKTNLLMINGPSVDKSGGTAWPETMGDAQEVGISFLERAVKAKKIAIIGRSLGGAAIAGAILQHDFKPEIKYLVIDMVTFDRVSNVCSKMFGRWPIKMLVKLVGLEIDSIKASQKLQSLNIPEVIIQASRRNFSSDCTSSLPSEDDFIGDGMVPKEASKGYTLIKEGAVTDGLTKFIGVKNLAHSDLCTAIQIATEELASF